MQNHKEGKSHALVAMAAILWVIIIMVTTQKVEAKLPHLEVHLLGVEQTYNSKVISNYHMSTIPLSDGSHKLLNHLYRPKDVLDTRFTFGTPLYTYTEDRTYATFMALYSASTGERAEKYTIDPSFGAGARFFLVHGYQGGNRSFEAYFNVHKVLAGGRLNEKTCTADFGELGTYQVGCRFAHLPIPVEETVKLGFHQYLRDVVAAQVRFTWRF